MSETNILIICTPGNKWTAPFSTSTPDPCPSGQKMSAVTKILMNQDEVSRLQSLDDRITSLEATTRTDFAVPTNQEIALAFSTAFTTVLLCFLVARGVGTVLNFIRHG